MSAPQAVDPPAACAGIPVDAFRDHVSASWTTRVDADGRRSYEFDARWTSGEGPLGLVFLDDVIGAQAPRVTILRGTTTTELIAPTPHATKLVVVGDARCDDVRAPLRWTLDLAHAPPPDVPVDVAPDPPAPPERR